MKKWMIETRTTVRRSYIVTAENEKEAEMLALGVPMDHEEDENEETMSITELVDAPT